MPFGKRCGSATMLPSLSRETCQQSSMTTYWYPASFMPDLTMASVMDLIRSSLTLQPNLFQLFQPIGGVGASLRSEEHTSELQSRFDLVCRLLLEKKKNLLIVN